MHRTESHFPSILTNSTNIRAHTEREPAAAAISPHSHFPAAFMAIENEELKAALKTFADERHLRHRSISQRAGTMLIDKLEELAPHDTSKQVEIVKNSIINGWNDFFPLPAPKPAKQQPPNSPPVSHSRNLYEETMAKVEKLTSANGGNNDDILFQ